RRVLGAGMEAAYAVLSPGATPRELDEAISACFAGLDPGGKLLTRAPGVPATGATFTWHVEPSSFNAAGEPSFPFPVVGRDRPFPSGDVVWNDSGVRYLGYDADFSRTWIVGEPPEPSERHKEAFKRWLELRDRAAAQLVPGKSVADVVGAVTSGDKRPWLSHFLLGHSIGLAAPEYPFLGADE